jgi:ubiquinone/menaquinone biosynthesis C-methylase UbiE
MINYYTNYYRDDCSLLDWEKRVAVRLEEETREVSRLRELEFILGIKFVNSNQLVVGAGTGGLITVLKQSFFCEVYGVEPCAEEYEIVLDRCREVGISTDNIKKEGAEQMSFTNNQFDFIHCFTVLEHVQNIEKSIDEMIRVLKPGGMILISTPNYSFPYERHYKIPFPTFLPKIFGKIFLKLLGKSTKFLDTINYIKRDVINKILVKKESIVWFNMYKPSKKKIGKLAVMWNYLIYKRFVYPNHDIFIKKIK